MVGLGHSGVKIGRLGDGGTVSLGERWPARCCRGEAGLELGGAWLARGRPSAVARGTAAQARGWARGGGGATVRRLGLGYDEETEVVGRLSNPQNRDRKGNGKGALKTREIH